MGKTLLFMFIICIIPSFVYAQDEVVVVLLNKDKCFLSRNLESLIKSPEFVQKSVENHQLVKAYYGNDYPNYIRKYRVEWYPTILKFRRNNDRSWTEKERIIGPKNLKNLLDFIENRSIIIQRTPQIGGS